MRYYTFQTVDELRDLEQKLNKLTADICARKQRYKISKPERFSTSVNTKQQSATKSPKIESNDDVSKRAEVALRYLQRKHKITTRGLLNSRHVATCTKFGSSVEFDNYNRARPQVSEKSIEGHVRGSEKIGLARHAASGGNLMNRCYSRAEKNVAASVTQAGKENHTCDPKQRCLSQPTKAGLLSGNAPFTIKSLAAKKKKKTSLWKKTILKQHIKLVKEKNIARGSNFR